MILLVVIPASESQLDALRRKMSLERQVAINGAKLAEKVSPELAETFSRAAEKYEEAIIKIDSIRKTVIFEELIRQNTGDS